MRNDRINLIVGLALETFKLVTRIIIVHIVADANNQLAFELCLEMLKIGSCSISCVSRAVITFEVDLLLTPFKLCLFKKAKPCTLQST